MTNHERPNNIDHEIMYREDEIDITELFKAIWRKRVIIILSTALFACLAFFVVVTQVLSPPVTTVSQQFSLQFAGIEDGKYPNGANFRLPEITAPHILEGVFEQNKLAGYSLEMVNFRDSITVNKSIEGLLFLEEKYQTLLGRKGLTAEERQILQDEYQQQRKRLFQTPYYKISWIDRTGNVPVIIQEKALLDILAGWARYAEERKGVYLYQVSVLTEGAFYFADSDEEYIVKVDMLRYVVTNIKKNLLEIAKLPGALLVETKSGEKLTNLQLRVNDLLNYQVLPLTGLIRSGGLNVNEEIAKIYTKEMLYTLKLEKGVLQGEMSLLGDSLDGYINSNDQLIGRRESNYNSKLGQGAMTGNTVIPQIGDRFLDQLVALANDNQDVAYRQEITTKMVNVGNELLGIEKNIVYYQELLKSKKANKKQYQVLLAEYKRKNERAINDAKNITKEMNELYNNISLSYLKVSESLYELKGPLIEDKVRAISVKKIGLIYGATTVVFFFMLCLIALLQSSFVGRKDNG